MNLMTRDEAKEMFRTDKDSYGKPKSIMTKLDKIFDEFELEKKTLQGGYRPIINTANPEPPTDSGT